MINFIIFAIIGAVAGAILTYIILAPRLKSHAEINNKIKNENKKLEQLNNELQSKVNSNTQLNDFLSHEILNKQKTVCDLEESASKTADAFLKDKMAIAENSFEQAMYKMSEELQKSREEYIEEYEKLMFDLTTALNKSIKESKLEQSELNKTLLILRKTVDAAVEANKRQQKINEENNFYRLVLSDIDKEEIQKLYSVLPYLRDKEPLNKVIWKVYYEKPYTSMIGRVVGQGKHTGIYKITNIENQMCYIGQAVDIASRWKQHIKRGLGAEPPTRNKLYPAMASFGVENFTFEIIEECPVDQLDIKEDEWQEYFHAKDFGYSIK